VWIILGIVLLLFSLNGRQSSLILDDYAIYDTFNIESVYTDASQCSTIQERHFDSKASSNDDYSACINQKKIDSVPEEGEPYVQCKENTCDGEEIGLDEHGCMKYKFEGYEYGNIGFNLYVYCYCVNNDYDKTDHCPSGVDMCQDKYCCRKEVTEYCGGTNMITPSGWECISDTYYLYASSWYDKQYECSSDLWETSISGASRAISTNEKWHILPTYTDVSGGNLVWDGEVAPNSDWRSTNGKTAILNMKSTKDFKGMYMKVIVNGHKKLNYYNGGDGDKHYYYRGNIDIDIGGIIYNVGGDDISLTSADNAYLKSYGDQLIEIKPSIIDPNYFEMWVNGQFYEGKTLGDTEPVKINIKGKGYIEIKEVKYKVPFASCSQKGNRILITESFAGPQSFNEFSFRYTPVQYCLDHPVIITDSDEHGSAITSEPYAKLSKGETFTIPSTQTYTFFYLAYNDGSIPMACDESSYSPERNRCEDVTAIVHLCSEGIFDPSLGSCVVSPEVKEVCEYGRYDVSLGMCVWNPPVHAICLEGYYNSVTEMCEVFPDTDYICEFGVFNPDTDMCEYTPPSGTICEEDYTYNSVTDKCEYAPPNEVICPYNTIYNPVTNICEQYPDKIISCPGGYTYNATSDTCEKYVATYIWCDGEYDSDTNICTKNVIVTCPDGRLEQNSVGDYVCIWEPTVEINCPKGEYDVASDKCIYTPDYVEGETPSEGTEDTEDIVDGIDNNVLFIIGGIFLFLIIFMGRR